MNQAISCPGLANYKKLISDQMSANDKEVLLSHLENCDACALELAKLPVDDTIFECFRQADTFGDDSSRQLVAGLVDKLSKLRPDHAAGDFPTQAEKLPESTGTIVFACEHCKKTLKVKESTAGKRVKCPSCQKVVTVAAVVSTTAHPDQLGLRIENLMDRVRAERRQESPPQETESENIDRELLAILSPSQSADELGRLGPYRVLKILGAGGMGVVFKAEDPQLQRLVALKAMLPTTSANSSAKKRFLREARAAAKIKHDHIVGIYQVGEDGANGTPYLAMEFLEGEPLDVCLQRQGALPTADVLRIGREIAEGLAAAHESGLIHRDIKPANIWLETRSGVRSGEGQKTDAGIPVTISPLSAVRVKILDFGLARYSGDESQITQAGAIVGTPAYMAPEQGQGKPVDSRCDLFSLGCVLYRMCTGHNPFRGADLVSTLLAVGTENPPTPSEMNNGTPKALSDLVMKLLAKDPNQRFSSASETSWALHAIETSLGKTAIHTLQAGPTLQANPPAGASLTQQTKSRSKPNIAGRTPRSQSLTAARPAGPAKGRRGFVWGAVGVLFVVAAVLTVIHFSTRRGDVVIETDDPTFAFKVSDDHVILEDRQTKHVYKLKVIHQDTTEIELEVTSDAIKDLAFQTKTFLIRRGEKIALKAWVERRAGFASGRGRRKPG